ncbi:hypothetical protein ES703_17347 [subsurface metagenome]
MVAPSGVLTPQGIAQQFPGDPGKKLDNPSSETNINIPRRLE